MAKAKDSMTSFKIREKKAYLDILERIVNVLDDEERNATSDFRCVGKEEEQAKDYKTGELLWEDEEQTIPKYRDRWDYVKVADSELTDDSKAKLRAINMVRDTLEKLI